MNEHMNQPFEFAQFLNEKMKERGFTFKKLAELTGISLRHLESMSAGNFGNLPSSPYFHGYLDKLGAVLEFDSHYWWTQFREMKLVQSSGELDKLPQNRFVPQSITKFLWIGAVAILLTTYIGFRFSKIVGRPDLSVIAPKESMLTTKDDSYTIKGVVSENSEVFINDESIPVNPDGSWEKTVSLQPGPTPNTYQIRAKKFLGSEVELTKQIFFQFDGQVIYSNPSSTPSSTPSSSVR